MLGFFSSLQGPQHASSEVVAVPSCYRIHIVSQSLRLGACRAPTEPMKVPQILKKLQAAAERMPAFATSRTPCCPPLSMISHLAFAGTQQKLHLSAFGVSQQRSLSL